MNLNEYKNSKIKEIDHFLRGLNFDNIGIKDKKIIEYLTPECDEYFNKDEVYRSLTERLLTKIREHYNNLVDTQLEYASSQEEIDLEIKKFVDQVRKEVDKYKHTTIKIAFQPKKETDEGVAIEELQEVKEKNLINTGLNFIKIKIGDIIYSAPKTHAEAEKEDVTLDNLNIIIVYVYVLTCMINDKKQKQEEFIDYIAQNFKVTDEEYLELRKLQGIFLNERNYDDFIAKYNAASEQVVSLVLERDRKEIEQVEKTSNFK